MIKIERTRERVNSNGGQVLVGALLDQVGFDRAADTVRVGDCANRALPNSSCLRAYVGLLAEGRTAFDEIEMFRDDELFREALKLSWVPSSPSLRQRLTEAEGKLDCLLTEGNIRFLSGCSISAVGTASGDRIPVDVDVSCQDNSRSHKQGVGRTYRGYDGFAPIFAYVGTEGHMLLNELRPGTQHCQKGTPAFLTQCLAAVEALQIRRPLFRLDSGNDAVENLRVLHDRADYLIKRNLRKEPLHEWLATARSHGAASNPRAGKTVWRGSIWSSFQDADGLDTPVRLVFEVTERRIAADGSALLLPELEVDTWWTNLEEDSAEAIIGLYHDHGTSEQFHSEFKGEIGLERLPSGSLAANRTVMLLGMIAYNILRRIGRDALAGPEDVPVRGEVSRRRIRKVIQDLVRFACKFVRTARQTFVKIRHDNPWTPVFERLYRAYT